MANRPNILLLQSDEHSYRFLSARSQADGGEPCRTPIAFDSCSEWHGFVFG